MVQGLEDTGSPEPHVIFSGVKKGVVQFVIAHLNMFHRYA